MSCGIKYAQDQFVDSLHSNFLPYMAGKKSTLVQVAVRPVNIYEIVFPKEHLGKVLKTFEGAGDPRLNGRMSFLRSVLRAKKIPKLDLSKEQSLLVYQQFVRNYPIGIKEDGVWPAGEMEGSESL